MNSSRGSLPCLRPLSQVCQAQELKVLLVLPPGRQVTAAAPLAAAKAAPRQRPAAATPAVVTAPPSRQPPAAAAARMEAKGQQRGRAARTMAAAAMQLSWSAGWGAWWCCRRWPRLAWRVRCRRGGGSVYRGPALWCPGQTTCMLQRDACLPLSLGLPWALQRASPLPALHLPAPTEPSQGSSGSMLNSPSRSCTCPAGPPCGRWRALPDC